MRADFLTGAAAALVLISAVSWLAPPGRAQAAPAAEAAEGETYELEGVIVREEFTVAAPEGAAVLIPDGARVSAGGALLAVGDAAAAVQALSREDPSVADAALREAVLAAALDEPERAEPLAAAYSAPSGGEYELVTAPVSAVWRSGADGYERLGPDTVADLDVEALRELLAAPAETGAGVETDAGVEDNAGVENGNGDGDGTVVAGVLVTGLRWYFAALAPEDIPVEAGQRLELSFPGFQVTARAESVSGAEGGVRALVFSSLDSPEKAAELRFVKASTVLSIGDR